MMKKRKKQARNKTGGNSFGMVIKSSVILFILIPLLCACCWNNKKVEAPPREPGIPESAIWHGGIDGGVWIDMDTTEIPNQFHVHCYFDGSGRTWEKGIFLLDSLSVQENYSIEKLHGVINGFDGVRIFFMPEMYEKNPNVVFKKKK